VVSISRHLSEAGQRIPAVIEAVKSALLRG
jgi:hypothetical protein